ncbi:protein-L-isoaspartate O-methyltransferase family protein [Methylocapsa palsarum]|uniref:Protein-L-isoaspartate O-methyltransferase n=1 Tax=Methylocapsa palsarum TaxID=1612308 RepID=A0A1I3XV85_9HYPH|nr:protein-L-isoaspartate O-methyltransferase [Methylocapsa palsarum]SFK22971.1 protein-L-isoaspartate(D-aspartate) O-methyltransferase [Methylocapsa palsarum]
MQDMPAEDLLVHPSPAREAPAEAAPAGDAGAESAFLRRTMVDCQIRTFDVTDRTVLARLLDVPRERFLPAELRPFAYSDIGLQIPSREPGQEQRTLLPPLILARLIQDAGVGPADRVLDVASSGGYSAALFAGLAGSVVAIESDPFLLEQMRGALDGFGLQDVRTVLAPLADGAPEEGPFDVIFINGAVEANLAGLFKQLKEGGRLLAIHFLPDDPTERAGKAVRFEKIEGEISSRKLFDGSSPVLAAFRKTPEFSFF